ncbi:AraC family transcriptional regulator [Cohnella yongneupensis]|uniref:AraC family transcriptional regulator n=1 Tax=Cohnella yongneupensis TaxID=425006 RepID=A0ABW0QVK2_9BACL
MNMDIVPKIRLIGFVSYTSPWIHFKRNTDEYILYFIKSGELHLRENGTEYVLKRGDAFLLEPNLDHEGTAKHACDYYYVHFSHADIESRPIDDIQALARRFILEGVQDDDDRDFNICYLNKHFTLQDKPALQQAYRAMQELLVLYYRKRYNRALTGLRFAQLLIELSRENLVSELRKAGGKSTKSFVKVNALLEYIHHHYVGKIASQDIEQSFASNFDYLNRIFKQATGYPIVQYVNKVRVDRAKELIQTTNLGMGEIGYLTGLNDPYYFSKVFKKYVGVSPLQYRQSLAGEERVDG